METTHIKILTFLGTANTWICEVLGEDDTTLTCTRMMPLRMVATPQGIAMSMGYTLPLISMDPLLKQTKTIKKNDVVIVESSDLTDEQIIMNYIKVTTGLDIVSNTLNAAPANSGGIIIPGR